MLHGALLLAYGGEGMDGCDDATAAMPTTSYTRHINSDIWTLFHWIMLPSYACTHYMYGHTVMHRKTQCAYYVCTPHPHTSHTVRHVTHIYLVPLLWIAHKLDPEVKARSWCPILLKCECIVSGNLLLLHLHAVQAMGFRDSEHAHIGMCGEVTFLQLLEEVRHLGIWCVRGSDEFQSVATFLLSAAPMGEVKANWLHQSGSIHVDINHHRARFVASGEHKWTVKDDGKMNWSIPFQSPWGNLQGGITASQSEGPSTRTNMEVMDPSSHVTKLFQKNFIWWFD